MMIVVLFYEKADLSDAMQSILGYLLLSLKILFMIFFGLGLGPIAWFYTGLNILLQYLR